MKVIDRREAFLCNYEVLSHLVSLPTEVGGEQARDASTGGLQTIKFELTQFLKQSRAKDQSEERIQALKQRLQQWKLTKAECLQIVNMEPRNLAELHILVEAIDERFTPEEQDEIVCSVREGLA